MQDVTLYFPDSFSLKEFVSDFQLSGYDINLTDQSLQGLLLENVVEMACSEYFATAIPTYQLHSFSFSMPASY